MALRRGLSSRSPGREPTRATGRTRPAFVATTGGHLVEMRLLASLVEPARHERGLWITHPTPQSESLLADEDVLFVEFVHARDIGAVLLRTPGILHALVGNRIDAVYSTGAAVALSALPLSRLVGARATYIESLTRASGPSATGRTLSLLPWVTVLTQYDSRAGRRWKFRASLMDRFIAVPQPGSPPPRRVFVTLGTAGRHGFRRLLDRLRDVLPADCDVVWQTGSTEVEGLAVARPMMSETEFRDELSRADVVVAHAGCGTFLQCLQLGKVPVMVPRRAAYREHVDDHQAQLARVAAARGLAIVQEADEVTWSDLCSAAQLRVFARTSTGSVC